MSEKPTKSKKAKKAADPGVLGNLSATRPDRLGGRRAAGSSRADAESTPARTAATTSAGSRSAAPRKRDARTRAAAPEVTPTPFDAPTTSDAAPPAPEAAEATPFEAPAPPRRETPAAEPGVDVPVRRVAPADGDAAMRTSELAAGPVAIRPATPALDPHAFPERDKRDHGLFTAALRIPGEIALLGLALGGQIARRVLDRLPRP